MSDRHSAHSAQPSTSGDYVDDFGDPPVAGQFEIPRSSDFIADDRDAPKRPKRTSAAESRLTPRSSRTIPPTAPAEEDNAAPVRRRPSRRASVVIAAATAAILAVGGGVALTQSGLLGADQSRAPASAPTTSQSAAPSGSAAPTSASESPTPATCPELRDDAAGIQGNGPGDQQSGPGVILAWNHAYYVARSGELAASFTAPNAVSPPPVIQEAINKVPEGSTHCVTITPVAPNTFRVLLTVFPPSSGQPGIGSADDPPTLIRQVITTADTDGKTWIISIRKGQ